MTPSHGFWWNQNLPDVFPPKKMEIPTFPHAVSRNTSGFFVQLFVTHCWPCPYASWPLGDKKLAPTRSKRSNISLRIQLLCWKKNMSLKTSGLVALWVHVSSKYLIRRCDGMYRVCSSCICLPPLKTNIFPLEDDVPFSIRWDVDSFPGEELVHEWIVKALATQ